MIQAIIAKVADFFGKKQFRRRSIYSRLVDIGHTRQFFCRFQQISRSFLPSGRHYIVGDLGKDPRAGREAGMKATAPTSGSPHQTLETLYRFHSREIWAMAYARWLDADLALDLVQEAFFRLWKQ